MTGQPTKEHNPKDKAEPIMAHPGHLGKTYEPNRVDEPAKPEQQNYLFSDSLVLLKVNYHRPTDSNKPEHNEADNWIGIGNL